MNTVDVQHTKQHQFQRSVNARGPLVEVDPALAVYVFLTYTRYILVQIELQVFNVITSSSSTAELLRWVDC